MKNKLITGAIGLVFALSLAIPAFAETTLEGNVSIVTRMDSVHMRLNNALSRIQEFSTRLKNNGQDSAALDAKIAVLITDRDNASTQFQQFKDAYVAAGNTITADVKVQGVEARDALKKLLMDTKDAVTAIRAAITTYKANHPTTNTPAVRGNVDVTGIPVTGNLDFNVTPVQQ